MVPNMSKLSDVLAALADWCVHDHSQTPQAVRLRALYRDAVAEHAVAEAAVRGAASTARGGISTVAKAIKGASRGRGRK